MHAMLKTSTDSTLKKITFKQLLLSEVKPGP